MIETVQKKDQNVDNVFPRKNWVRCFNLNMRFNEIKQQIYPKLYDVEKTQGE